jgi:4'-phosphopantetheinyl transferase
VESVRMPVDIQIADRYFALAEVAALRALPTEQQQHRFLEYWTLKESYIKARGTGLSIPLDRFEFELGLTVGIRLRLDPILRDSGEAWRFWQPQVGRNHVAAVCAKRCSAERLQIGSVRDWLRRKPAFC